MTQAQHKSRQRGRGGQRRSGSPTSRVFESNGPDVKVRGTAQTVADKYQQLARDANSAGDHVTAESYYQHAEHYLRIIAANQPPQQQQQQQKQQAGAEAGNPGQGDGNAKGDARAQAGTGDTPGRGPQPDAGNDKKAGKAAAASTDTPAAEASDGFDGQPPGFLAKPVIDSKPEDGGKPKRARKSSPRSRSKAGNGEVTDGKDAADVDGDVNEVAENGGGKTGSPDTEVVVS